jgi:hypothetical protein
MKWFSKQVKPQNKPSVAIFIYDKADFKSKFVLRDKESHFILIKVNSPTKGYNNYKHVCIECQDTQFYKTNIT